MHNCFKRGGGSIVTAVDGRSLRPTYHVDVTVESWAFMLPLSHLVYLWSIVGPTLEILLGHGTKVSEGN